MRVLFVSHSYIPRFNREKLRMIARLGVEIGLLAPGNWRNIAGLFDGQPAFLEEPSADREIRVFSGLVIRPGHIASYLFRPGIVGEVLNEFAPDLIQIEQEIYSFAAAQISVAARAAGKRIVVFSWENLDRRIHLLQRFARWITIGRINGVISGNVAGEQLMRKWGFCGMTANIPQVGVDTSMFAPRQRDRTRRITIGFVGRLVPEKGVGILLRAAAMLLQWNLDFDILICGAGPERGRLALEASEFGIASRVAWQGVVPHLEVPDIMARLDVLVLPSLRIASWAEQFGLVIAQAMAMGIPVLGSDSGAIPEVIGRKDSIFPEGDAGALAELLAGLILSESRRDELREYGIGRARALYAKEQVAKRTVEFWEQICGPPIFRAMKSLDFARGERTEPLVYVIVITFNGKHHLEACFSSLSLTDYSNKCVCLVDNGSNDGSLGFTNTRFPWVKVIRHETNLGFAGGNNQAMQLALDQGAAYIVLLNDDTMILDPHWLRDTVAQAEKDLSTGMIGFRLLGKVPQPPESENRQAVTFSDVERIDGCAVLMRGDLLRRIGLFDEAYFAYSEEDDLQARAVRAGARLRQADIPLYHYGGGTSRRFPLRFSYLQMRNSIRYSVKNRRPIRTLARIVKIFGITSSPWPIFFDASDASHVRMRGNGNILLNFAAFLWALGWNLLFLPATLNARKRDDARICGS